MEIMELNAAIIPFESFTTAETSKNTKNLPMYNNTACIRDRNKALMIKGFKTKETIGSLNKLSLKSEREIFQ